MSLLCLGLRPGLSRFAVDGPAFTSIFQGATRWQTYVALAVSGNLHGEIGLALASVAMVAIIPLVTRPCWRRSSRCRPFSRPSPCRSRLRWWRNTPTRA
jgi:hypothetical protein